MKLLTQKLIGFKITQHANNKIDDEFYKFMY